MGLNDIVILLLDLCDQLGTDEVYVVGDGEDYDLVDVVVHQFDQVCQRSVHLSVLPPLQLSQYLGQNMRNTCEKFYTIYVQTQVFSSPLEYWPFSYKYIEKQSLPWTE